MNKKVIIIGAGIAGLSAASYLQMSGYDTEIYEMHDLPGGLCTTWERKGYLIDGTIHWLIGSRRGSLFNNLWQELIDINAINFAHFDTYGVFCDNKGNSVNFYTDTDKLEKELLDIAPEDKKQIKLFCNLIRKFEQFEPPANALPELMNTTEKMLFIFKILRYIPLLKKYLKISIREFATGFNNPLLRLTFENLFSPSMALIFILINLVWLKKGDAAYPIGGSLAFARKIEKTYLKCGGKINYLAKVGKILHEENGNTHTTRGIELKSGERIFADIVISAADVHATLFHLLDAKFIPQKWSRRFDTLQTFPSYIQVSLGINRKFHNEPHKCFLETKNKYKINDDESIKGFNYRIHDFDPTLAPKGKTLLTTMIEVSDYTYWVELRNNNRKRYLEEKHKLSDFVINELEAHIGAFKDDIEMCDISTPATVIRYTGNWHGSFEGWILNTETGFNTFERQLPGLENFYMAGQWIEPGGGIPYAFMSGRNLARIICKKNDVEFSIKRAEAKCSGS